MNKIMIIIAFVCGINAALTQNYSAVLAWIIVLMSCWSYERTKQLLYAQRETISIKAGIIDNLLEGVE